METRALRAEIDGHIAAGESRTASNALARLWEADPGPATAPFVVSRFEKLKGRLSLVPYRLAILRSFTVEPLIPPLRAGAFAGGIELSVYLGEFNVYAQEIFAPESALYRFQPQAVVLAIETREIAPELWWGSSPGEPEEHRAPSNGRRGNCESGSRLSGATARRASSFTISSGPRWRRKAFSTGGTEAGRARRFKN